jgi:hypothetical protein
MHGAQRLRGVRLQKRLLQIEPEFRPARRSHCQGRQLLLDPVLCGRTQFQSVMRHKMKQPQQHLRIPQRRRLLQKNQRRPRFRNLLLQLHYRALHRTGMPEVNPHPIRSGKFLRIRSPNLPRGGFVLGFPAERVIVTPVAEMQKTPRRHQEFQRSIQLLPHRRPQRTRVRPVAQFAHGGDQR